ncbi:MAG: M56 family metallopeptidase [Planctomycetota bacterium]|jgi:beta-lactamase regulating signal transducer with metallopeptidase domain
MEHYLTQTAEYLFSQSWQIAVLAVVITGLSLLLRRKSAHIRYCLWLVLLAKCFVPPLLTVPVAVLPPQPVPAAVTEAITPASAATVETVAVVYDPAIVSEPVSLTTAVSPDVSLTTIQWLALAWIVGTVVFLFIAGIRAMRLHTWLKRERKPMNVELQADIQNLFAGLNKKHLPHIWRVDGIGQPFVWGVLKGSIYLPADFCDIESDLHRRSILSHELSHVMRFDAAVNLAQILAQAVFWFHPLIWWANRQIRLEREKCCDEMAIAWLGTKAKDFSAAIVKILTAEYQSSRPVPSLAVAGPVKNIEDRIKTMMNPNKKFYKRPGILTAMTILILGLILVPTTLALTSPTDSAISDTQPVLSESADPVDPNAIKADMKLISKQIFLYQRTNGHYPDSLQQLKQTLPKDKYSSSGQDYQIQSNRKYFLIGSCGPDHIYGNDDDILYYVNEGRLDKRHGLRPEIEPLLEEDDPNSQIETTRPGSDRPTGNCSLSGKVVCAKTGEPVTHAKVYLFHLGTFAPIFINVAGDGSFEFKDIPTGPFSLRTIHTAGYQETVYNPEGNGGKFPQFSLAHGEQRTGVTLVAEPAFQVSGTIYDPEGRPLKDSSSLFVIAWVERPHEGGNLDKFNIAKQQTVAADGKYVLDGLDGRPVYIMVLDFRAHKKDTYYPPCYYPGTVARDEAIKVEFDSVATIEDLDIHLTKQGEFTLEGIVADAVTGGPIPETLVTIHHRDMLFDRVTAYTDENGHYQITCLGAGEFQIHVDAEPSGYVRARQPVSIGTDKTTQLDFTLKQGAEISGRIVDENGDSVLTASGAYGLAYQKGYTNPETMSWSGVCNRNTDEQRSHGNTFNGGTGDYVEEYMDFPTPDTFVVKGIIPGETMLRFHPKAQGATVKKIMYNGQDITHTGLKTESGEMVTDVTIVVGAP